MAKQLRRYARNQPAEIPGGNSHGEYKTERKRNGDIRFRTGI